MPLITFVVEHGRTLEEARQRLDTAVDEVHRCQQSVGPV
jgi:predicted RNase H-like HicB family nuclease